VQWLPPKLAVIAGVPDIRFKLSFRIVRAMLLTPVIPFFFLSMRACMPDIIGGSFTSDEKKKNYTEIPL
jgi:hypothetical protein